MGDSLSEDQKCTLEVARVIREDFLQQNGFSPYDYTCPLPKTIGMMRCIVKFRDLAQKVIASGSGDSKFTWNDVMKKCGQHHVALTKLKFLEPKSPTEELNTAFDAACEAMDKDFANMTED